MKIINQFKRLQKNSKIKLRYQQHITNLFCGIGNLDFGVEIKVSKGKAVKKKYEKFLIHSENIKESTFMIIRANVDNQKELEVFANLIEYILFEISKKNKLTPSDIKTYIEEWLNFSNGKPLQISIERQIGLIGELIFLSKMMKEFPKSDQLNNWQGPEGAKIDFIFSDKFGVEIKSRIQPFKDWIKISSIEQLDNSLIDQHMVVCDFLPSDSGNTLKKLSDDIIELLNDRDQTNRFIEKMSKAKFDYFHDYSNLIKVNSLGVSVYNTKNNDFPFLKKGEDLRIDKINYEINISNLKTIEFSETISKAHNQLE